MQIRQMKTLLAFMATSLLALLANGQDSAFWGFTEDVLIPYQGRVWQTGLGEEAEKSYAPAVQRLLKAFEEETGKALRPGTHRKAALKIYTSSGAGLRTPHELVRAVIGALESRGFRRSELMIVDAREDRLREAGYLPPLSRIELVGPYFEGVRVHSLDSRELVTPEWYYDSPLPREFSTPLGRALLQNAVELDPEEARKSYLPTPLLTDVDFWINLPMVCHHPATGFSGALVNASLFNITNGTRFFNSPANAPVAVAEIASIPELKANWALTLLSLNGYQVIGGPAFNANYTFFEPALLMAVDAVALDQWVLGTLNRQRRALGFEELAAIPEFVEYATQLGLGVPVPRLIELP